MTKWLMSRIFKRRVYAKYKITNTEQGEKDALEAAVWIF